MAHYRVPGLSIAVFDDGELVSATGFGTAGSDRSVTHRTMFQAGSISKPVTAVAALRLVDEGILNLDEDVGEKLRQWELPSHSFQQPVTLRRILSHNAGLSVTGFPGHRFDAELPTTIDILNGRGPANTAPVRVTTEPGGAVHYSGGGFMLVQLLIEEVTSKPFSDALQELVLGPALMENSTFEQRLRGDFAELASDGFAADGSRVEGGHYFYPEQAAGGLWTTPSDLVRFAAALRADSAGTGNLLRQETARTMFSPQAGIYGLGIRLERHPGGTWFWHTGGAEGFRAHLRGDLDNGRVAVVMANGEDGMQLIREVFEGIYELLGRLGTPRRNVRVAALDPTPYGGHYHYRFEAFERSLSVRPDNGGVLASSPTLWFGERVWLPESKTRFFAPDGDTQIEMKFDENGGVEGLTWGSYWFQKVE